MKQQLEVVGITTRVRANDFDAAMGWYVMLLGRPPDEAPEATVAEWELLPNCWLQLAKGTPAPDNGPLHLGVADIETERERLQKELQVTVSPIDRIEGEVAWCSFDDPFGNRLGLFQDLADVTALA